MGVKWYLHDGYESHAKTVAQQELQRLFMLVYITAQLHSAWLSNLGDKSQFTIGLCKQQTLLDYLIRGSLKANKAQVCV